MASSTLICEYLDDVFPDRPLMPKDPYLRTQMRLWSKLVDEQIFEATREISFSAHFRYKMQTMTPEQREIRYANVGDPERRARFLSTFEQGTESPYVLYAIGHFEKAFKAMDRALAGGGPWLLGDAYTLADVNMIPYVARLHYLDLLDIWTGDHPRAALLVGPREGSPEHGRRDRKSFDARRTRRDAAIRFRYSRRGPAETQRIPGIIPERSIAPGDFRSASVRRGAACGPKRRAKDKRPTGGAIRIFERNEG